MKRAYIITFDKKGLIEAFSYTELHNKLTTARGIESWWHYLNYTYIIIVDMNTTAKNVCDFLITIMGGKEFFICEINLNNYNGFLNPEAWKWIEEQIGQGNLYGI